MIVTSKILKKEPLSTLSQIKDQIKIKFLFSTNTFFHFLQGKANVFSRSKHKRKGCVYPSRRHVYFIITREKSILAFQRYTIRVIEYYINSIVRPGRNWRHTLGERLERLVHLHVRRTRDVLTTYSHNTLCEFFSKFGAMYSFHAMSIAT